jgi:hypothetical protein
LHPRSLGGVGIELAVRGVVQWPVPGRAAVTAVVR